MVTHKSSSCSSPLALNAARPGELGFVIREIDAPDIRTTWPVMRQLRTHLAEDEYAEQVVRMRQTDHFRLIAIYRDHEVCAVAGFRMMEMLYCGRILSIDDLVVDEKMRSMGLGRQLLGWLREKALELECSEIHLDSRFIRVDAHRFYRREGFGKLGFHFVMDLDLHRQREKD